MDDTTLQITEDEPGLCAQRMGEALQELTTALVADNMELNARNQQVLWLTHASREAWEARGGQPSRWQKNWASTTTPTVKPTQVLANTSRNCANRAAAYPVPGAKQKVQHHGERPLRAVPLWRRVSLHHREAVHEYASGHVYRDGR